MMEKGLEPYPDIMRSIPVVIKAHCASTRQFFKAFLLTGKTYVEGTSASVGSTQVEPAVEVMLIKAI